MDQQAHADWEKDERVSALKRYGILDTPPEPEFDDVVRLAAQVCETPIALITLIDDRRQWFKAEVGLGMRETPLDSSICAKAILQPGLFVVPDTAKDPRFKSNPLVSGAPGVRFYAGALLESSDGLPLGTVCVLDFAPRGLRPDQEFALKTLARQVMSQLELRRAIAEREEALAVIRQAEQGQALLVRELHHRVGNTLALVQALLGTSARPSKSVPEFYGAFSARIASLAKTQKLLTDDYWQTASLRAMLLHELRLFTSHDSPRVILRGAHTDLSADLAIPLGMGFHELVSNAMRHGALSGPEGRVEVTWEVRLDGGRRKLHLEWTERGGPPVREPLHAGFGLKLLNSVLAQQCNGSVEIAFERKGFRFAFDAPLIEHRLVPAY
jgi:two-component sensor histidine kinase